MDLMRQTLIDPIPADPETPTAPPPATESVPAQREEFLVSVFAWD